MEMLGLKLNWFCFAGDTEGMGNHKFPTHIIIVEHFSDMQIWFSSFSDADSYFRSPSCGT